MSLVLNFHLELGGLILVLAACNSIIHQLLIMVIFPGLELLRRQSYCRFLRQLPLILVSPSNVIIPGSGAVAQYSIVEIEALALDIACSFLRWPFVKH